MYSVDDLYAFAALIETGSVTAAASHLQLNPATVSRRLTKLENHLGVPLFLRNTRSFSVTTEGQDFYTNVAEAITLLRAAENNLIGQSTAPSGKLRIALPSWVLHRFVQPNLADFLDAHPNVQLDLLTTDDPISLIGEGRDIGIRIGDLGDSSLKARRLYNDSTVLCASPDYLNRHGTPTRVDDLNQHVLLQHPGANVALDASDDQPAQRIEWRNRHWVNTAEAAHTATLAHHGVAQLYREQVGDDLAAGRLVSLLHDSLPSTQAPVWFIRTDGRLGTPKVDAFRNFIFKQCAGDGAHLPA
ncbi:MAG: LysR family transcriptional regulator [Pseudomonadota bacterium]